MSILPIIRKEPGRTHTHPTSMLYRSTRPVFLSARSVNELILNRSRYDPTEMLYCFVVGFERTAAL